MCRIAFVVRVLSALARSSAEPSTASRSFSGRSTFSWTPRVRAVAADSDATSLISSAIDTMANLPLLYWAADHADDGSFRLAGEAHAQMTRAAFVRSDFSTYHAVEYDLVTGERTRGFTFQGFSSAARLENITIKNALAPNGAGILFSGVSPTIEGCWILANTANSTGGGGVAMASSASPRLVSCKFAGNVCSGSNGGGGVWNVGGSPVFVNCVFSGNRTQGVGLVGGAIYTTQSGAPVITNCASGKIRAKNGMRKEFLGVFSRKRMRSRSETGRPL